MSKERKYSSPSDPLLKRRSSSYASSSQPTTIPPIQPNRVQLKKILLFFSLFCVFIYAFIDSNLKVKLLNQGTPKPSDTLNKSGSYFVNTPGCKIPSFPTIINSASHHVTQVPNIACKKPLIKLTKGNQLVVNLNESELLDLYGVQKREQVKCYYQEIKMVTDHRNSYMSLHHNFLLAETPTPPIQMEYIKVVCSKPSSLELPIYMDFFFIALPKHSLPASDNKLSVMILGVDSVSRLNFLRHMNFTADVLKNHFNSFEFAGFSAISDSAYDHVVASMTGLTSEELGEICITKGKTENLDNCPFLWKRFKDVGYVTSFAEDIVNKGIFRSKTKGFVAPPTDYYLNPIVSELEQYLSSNEWGTYPQCLNGWRRFDLLINYIRKLYSTFTQANFFSFLWQKTITNDFLNAPSLIDEDIGNLLLEWERVGILNNTVLILTSSHGLSYGPFRRTYQGMMEERQPLLSIVVPKWFKHAYSAAYENLKWNSHMLTTPFDLHATLFDIRNPFRLTNEEVVKKSTDLLDLDNIPREISLFSRIPPERTCENAAITPHWCTCHLNVQVPTNSDKVTKAARYTVRLINERIKPFTQCRPLFLNSISVANIGVTNKKTLRDNSIDDYLTDITIRIQTKPGFAEFESTIRFTGGDLKLIGRISRINMFADNSYCINDDQLKPFCYCFR